MEIGMKKRTSGTVGLEVNNERIRIRLPRSVYGGQQKYLYLGLDANNKTHWKIARAKAGEIEADILFERFDPTLAKYKPPTHEPPAQNPPIEAINLSTLWEAYTAFKVKYLSPSSLKDFKKTKNHINRLPTQSLKEARSIAAHLRKTLTPDAARRALMQINACCTWAADNELIEDNPFGKLAKVKVAKNQQINPFTATERDLIIKSFEKDDYHRHYANFVKFLFATGCRTSEAVGLCWHHIDPEFRFISFQESVVDGCRQAQTKTHKSRRFPVNDSLRELLLEIKESNLPGNVPAASKFSDSVFTDQSGNLVRPNNFLRRHWTPVVKSLPIQYRPQYNTRHTFVTLCLEAKVPVAQIAAWVGNSPKVIWEHYAGLVPGEVPPL